MAHRHLVLAYAVTWAFQLGYLAWLGLKWKSQKKTAAQQQELFHP
jgi:hypothetical protein